MKATVKKLRPDNGSQIAPVGAIPGSRRPEPGGSPVHLSVTDVSRTYGGAVHALGPISVDLKKNEFFAVVGPSGCGKSTFLDVLAGLSPVTGGEIRFEGRPVNAKAVESIIAATKLPVQLGGGIRNIGTIEDWLSRGVERVVLGTAAVRNPSLVKEASKKFPGRVAVSIDSREGLVAVEGWRETSTMRTLDLALDMEQAGGAAIVFTDINRDGAMGGINLEATVDLAFALTTPVIASGGVSSLEDIVAVKREEKSGIAGVICGRALYDGRVDPAAALAVMNGT